MNNTIKQLVIGSLFVAAQAMSLSAFAHEGPQAPEGFVGDRQGHVVTDGFGGCVKTGFPAADAKCAEPAVVAEAPAPAPAPAPVAQTITLSASALFDYDKATLRPEGEQELGALASKLKGMSGISQINVVGHTDSRGSDAYNQGLSERRATSVKSYLEGQGVDGAMISTSGMGESSPVASNDTDEGRQQNRRVEITIK